MNILAFDTCLDKMYVALGENDKILASKIIETTQSHYHSAFLVSTIRDILKENNLTPQDINAIATNIGPGSFTGIRACTTVARVFAQANNCKAIGVSSLEILSLLTSHFSPLTLVALDARKEMAYVAVYEGEKQIFEPQAISIEKVKEMLAEKDYQIITDDKLQPILGGISYLKQNDDLGKYLIQIVYKKLTDGDCETDWRKLHPLYIQPPAVNIKK
ncbi:MAG: tRNA (adenosine(37)-N6)-threonylcarbamoyltransferase complex dimerization subunit type 1 TsaB [Candidatus Gastranaerophilaceae bacterium]